MKLKTLRLATGLALTAAAGIAQAAAFPVVDARVAGMGGVAVATANLDSAAFYNPALLATQNFNSNFSLAVNGGVTVADPNGLIGAASDFTNAIQSFNGLTQTQLTNDPTLVQTDFNNLLTSVNNLGGKSFTMAVPGNFNTGFTIGNWAAAVTGQGFINAGFDVVAQGGGSPSIIDSRTNTPLTSFSQITGDPTVLQYVDTNAELQVSEVVSTEVGLSLARKLNIAGLDLSIGLTPKMVSISSATGTQPLSNAGSVPSLTTGSATSDFNMDAGVVWNLTHGLRVAGTIRNLIGKTYGTYDLKPQVRAGIGYSSTLFTAGADLDLTENDNLGQKSRILAVGAEFNAWYAMQLRVGYRQDMANNLTQYSAGFGLINSLVNVAAIVNPNDPAKGTSIYAGFGVNF